VKNLKKILTKKLYEETKGFVCDLMKNMKLDTVVSQINLEEIFSVSLTDRNHTLITTKIMQNLVKLEENNYLEKKRGIQKCYPRYN